MKLITDRVELLLYTGQEGRKDRREAGRQPEGEDMSPTGRVTKGQGERQIVCDCCVKLQSASRDEGWAEGIGDECDEYMSEW